MSIIMRAVSSKCLDTLVLVMPFFIAFLGTDHLCSSLGSGDAVLKLLRNQDVVNTFVTSTAIMVYFFTKELD